MKTAAFWVKPGTPTAADRLTLRQQAEALLAPTLPDAPADEAYADVQFTPDDEIGIGVGDRISVWQPGAYEPRNATVLAVRDDGQYLIHVAYGVTKWVWERDITLLVKAGAMEDQYDLA